MDPKPLSLRVCFFLILLFGIAAYSNTFHVPFQYDDVSDVAGNYILKPPLDLGKIWESYPPRYVTSLSFALQFAITGSTPWGFHVVNLLIHLLASITIFGITRLLLKTPVLRDTIPSSQCDLFALGPALLFLAHPVQTESVTYIVQRLASLATLFYLLTLWMYLKARLENTRHYRLAFLFMTIALLTKEICLTLPLAIGLVDFCFFPISETETVFKKIRRWLPFAILWGAMLIYFYASSAGKIISNHGAVGMSISPWDYFLTQFRVLRTYLRLLMFPVNQCIDYDYRLSTGWGDLDTWAAFSLLFSMFILALVFFKKQRLLSFGILWFFLTLSIESSFIPLKDVLVEHRLYLPMLGFSLFAASFLWQCLRSPARFIAVILAIAIIFSGMTYARNEVWKSPFSLWQDTIRKSPHKCRPYTWLGDSCAYELKDYKTALFYYKKAISTGSISPPLLAAIANAYSALGDTPKSTYFKEWAISFSKAKEYAGHEDFFNKNQATLLIANNNVSEATRTLLEASRRDPRNPSWYIQLGELYRASGQADAAIASFRKAIEVAPASQNGYNALALLYGEKGEEQKAVSVLVEYLKAKRKYKPIFGN